MFTQYEGKWNEEINVCGIPFKVFRNGETGRLETIEMNGWYESPIEFSGQCEALFFAGMSVTQWFGSEWWGKNEAEYNLADRLFVGDRVATARIIYTDGTQDYFEVIFGVNCWCYLQHCALKPNEVAFCNPPFDEPFKSDPNARKLFDASMKMMEYTGEDYEMGNKWVFGFRTNPKKTIRLIKFCQFKVPREFLFISGITGVNAGEALDPAWKIMNQREFISRSWFNDADRLKRRLYTFRDSIPESVPVEEIEGFDAPDIRFEGSASASIYTNVYRMNIIDMARNKVDANGEMHTSSLETYNFGDYGGIGLFKKGESYYSTLVSRDVGRTMTEITNVGYTERPLQAAEKLREYLYYQPGPVCTVPHWRRDANIPLTAEDIEMRCSGAAWENDGHGSLMMFIYSLYNKGVVDEAWLREHHKMLVDAGNAVMWQLENPEEANVDGALYSFSEASEFRHGGYDLFSNILVAAGLDGFARMMDEIGDGENAARFRQGSAKIREGVENVFTMQHPRFGEIYSDSYNCLWTYDYKRFCHTFMHSDLDGYDMASDVPEQFAKLQRTFDEQMKERYYSPFSGAQMGYGQGYLTVAAIMLDRYDEFTACMDAIAGECYHAYDHPYIVPEGVIRHGSGEYWFRQKDLGNGVQQGETTKCARLLMGIDDVNHKRGLRLIPRIPNNWNCMTARDYPVNTEEGAAKFDFRYERVDIMPDGCTVFAADNENAYAATWSEDVPVQYIRMGPFNSEDIEVTGGTIEKCEKILDKWFVTVVTC